MMSMQSFEDGAEQREQFFGRAILRITTLLFLLSLAYYGLLS